MTYKIVRYQFYGEPEVVKRGLTLEEARKYCSDPKTEGIDWFEGYTKEIAQEDPADRDDRLYHEEQDHIAMEKAKETK